jgi:protein TonB
VPEKPPPAAPKEAPAPAAAQAGKVLTAEPTPDEPLDLTGDAFVQGNADYYAGGITASKGTSTEAVRNQAARSDGVVGGTGTAPASSIDRSRAAGTVGTNWDCPFPAEAELEQINYQQVRVAVTVSAQGKALEVKVIGDTSFGFGRAAQRCALSKAYIPALDRGGNPITTTVPIVVTFVRR